VACFGLGAQRQARDLAAGNVVYREVLALADTVRGSRVVSGDGGSWLLLNETLVHTDLIESVYGTRVAIPGDGRAGCIGAKLDSIEGEEQDGSS
jgi:hypothetical protein